MAELKVIAFSILAAMLSGPAFSKDAWKAKYFCPKYEASFQFTGRHLSKSYGSEFPSEHHSTYSSTGNSLSDINDCSTTQLLCIEERVQAENAANSDVVIYAVPRTVRIGETYDIRGVKFKIDRQVFFPRTPAAAVIVADAKQGDGQHLRYKMYVEQGVGIRHLFFDRLRGFFEGNNLYVREYTDVTCTLKSTKGLFPEVRLDISPPPDVIDN